MQSMQAIDETVARMWQGETLQALCDFVRIPARSVGFDPNWEQNGFLLQACEDAARWAKTLFPNAVFEVLSEPGRSPALFFEIPASGCSCPESVFFYGHFDKQPEGEGWTQGRKAFTPSVEGRRLYGRGAADDGYNFYAAMTALAALDENGAPRPRAVGLYETAEECESVDFAYWLEKTAPRIGRVGFVSVLDGTCCDYDRLWTTVSFRGALSFTLNVRVLQYGVHSGTASGIVPESFTIARALLERIEKAQTAEISAPELNVEIPEERLAQLRHCASILGEKITGEFPWAGSVHARNPAPFASLVMRGWKPQLAVTGAEGLPALENAGNVLRAGTRLKCSMRIAPTLDPEKALEYIRRELTRDPIFGCTVTLDPAGFGPGWNAPAEKPWFTRSFDAASRELFGKSATYCCDGASIPILSLMQRCFGDAQYLVTGVLGPGSNAHGPDEMLDLDYVSKLTSALARIIAAIGRQDENPQAGGAHAS